MATRRLDYPIEPMTLGNMRANGVRSLTVSCWTCHHKAVLSAEPWPDDLPVRTFGPRPSDVGRANYIRLKAHELGHCAGWED